MVSHREKTNPGMAANVYENVKKISDSFYKHEHDIELISNTNDSGKTREGDEKSNQILLIFYSNYYSKQKFYFK